VKASEIHEFFGRLAAQDPEPRTELAYTNPYTLLIAVVLSAQATDKSVNIATQRFFKEVRTPQAMLDFGEAALQECIRSIGLYRTKAKNIMELSRILAHQFQGQVPQDRTSLEALPGVGRKTANVVLNVAFGQPTLAVDTHIFRVANRTGLAPGKTPRAVEDALLQVVPDAWLLHAHNWLILHGRYVCVARSPKCNVCCVRDLCAQARTLEPRAIAVECHD